MKGLAKKAVESGVTDAPSSFAKASFARAWGSSRSRLGAMSSGSLAGRLVGALVLLIGAIAILVLLVPALLLGGAVLAAVIALVRVRQWLSRFIGDQSGRKNVRPIPPR